MKYNLLKSIVTVCMSAASLTLAAALPELNGIEDRFYFAYPVKKAPVIDGRLEAEFWNRIPRAKYFVIDNRQTDSVSKPTMFRIAYDDQFLYIGATMWESTPELIKSAPTKKDGWPETDRINFIFSKTFNRKGSYQDSPYIFVMFGAGGIHRAFRNILPGKLEKSVDEPVSWETAWSYDDKHWYIESRIPFHVLGFSPKDKQIFFNVRRDIANGPVTQKRSQWSSRISATQGAHSFGILIFNAAPGNLQKDEFRLNRKPRHWYMRGRILPLARKKSEYLLQKQIFGNMPGWNKAEEAVDKIARLMKRDPETISDEIDDLYMEWLKQIHILQTSAPKQDFKIHCRDAEITSLSLNGYTVTPENGKYMLAFHTGVNALKIKARVTGADPGIRLDLNGSPETSNAVNAIVSGKPVPIETKNGYLWPGKAKNAEFTQNLIWNREYCNHPQQFIFPGVKEWGVSPGETMFFIHRLFNPLQNGACHYQLEVEVPEGFVRVNDISPVRNGYHFWTKNIKTEKIILNGKKYIRFTYIWNLPEKRNTREKYYIHYLAFRNEYPFKPGEKTEFRFRRIVNGNTTDMVNTVSVVPLPEIRGGKLTNVMFPQYDPFMYGKVSYDQWQAMADDSCKAGLNSFILQQAYTEGGKIKSGDRDTICRNQIITKKKTNNFVWIRYNIPQWGAGRKGNLRKLVEKTPDLQARYYKDSGSYANGFYGEFCLTNATGKYRSQVKEAILKDYQNALKTDPACNYIFLNDENFPSLHQWRHAWCFCNICKEDFRNMFKIPASEQLTDEVIVTRYEEQWNLWWRSKQKGLLLKMAYEAAHQAGAKLFYYHQAHDTQSYQQARGSYDMVCIPLPGCASFCGDATQAEMDSSKKRGIKITGKHQSMGQFVTYTRNGNFYSSDGCYFHPKEVKQVLIRAAAISHNGAICESAAFFSAGALYYAGVATQIIAEFEDLFYNGTRADNLAVSDTFQYPSMLVLMKNQERLVLIFNESQDKVKTGILKNLGLKPGQTARIWGSDGIIKDPSAMTVTVLPQDVTVIHIK